MDSDFNNSPLTIVKVNGNAQALGQQITLASGALVTLNNDGTFNYDPNDQFTGLRAGQTETDTFTYQIRNNDNLTDTGIVTITLTGENDAPTKILLSDRELEENHPIDRGFANLSNDDPDTGDTASYSLVTGIGSTDNGRFTIVNDQLQFKTWLDFQSGKRYDIRVRTTDGAGASIQNAVKIHSFNQNKPVNLTVSDLQVGLTPTSGSFTLDSVSNATNGRVNLVNGQVVFTPNAGFLGMAQFDYTLIDGNQQTQTRTANLALMPFVGKQTIDSITGTSSDDTILGLQGKDNLRGGGGDDRFVYTSLTDGGDTLYDFNSGDQIDLAGVLRNVRYNGNNPIADRYVRFLGRGSDTILQIDPDGLGSAKPSNFILVKGIDVATLNNPDNFIF